MTTIRSKRSGKEWLAITFLLASGAGVALFTIMMYFQTYYHQWIFWIFAFLFLLLAVVNLTKGFSRLLQPASDQIVIDQRQRTLITWRPDGERLVFGFDDIRAVLLKEIFNNENIAGQPESAKAHVLCIETRDGREQIITSVRPARKPAGNFTANSYSAAHVLAQIIADKTGKLFQKDAFRATPDPLLEIRTNY